MQHYIDKPRTTGLTTPLKGSAKKFDNDNTNSSQNDFDKKRHHHHHHHHGHSSHRHRHTSRRHHHHHHHHHHHRPRHHHHHHHHHRRSHSHSTCSECSDHSRDYHQDYYSDPHYSSVRLPRIVTPQPVRIITPTPRKANTSIVRDVGINTGKETKIMKDTGVTVDLIDPPNVGDRRLEQIPVIRRTIIVEPYPAQPTSQIIVKPRADMIGKVRLGKNMQLNGDDETVVYPSTAFMTKKGKKKKSTLVNNNVVEDLNLDGLHDDDKENRHRRSKNPKIMAGTKIKNAFYN